MMKKPEKPKGKRMPGMSSKSEVVSVRLGTDEFNRLKDIADQEGMPVSALIRRIVRVPTTSGGTIIRLTSANPTPECVVGQWSAGSAVTELRGTAAVQNYRYTASPNG